MRFLSTGIIRNNRLLHVCQICTLAFLVFSLHVRGLVVAMAEQWIVLIHEGLKCILFGNEWNPVEGCKLNKFVADRSAYMFCFMINFA